MDNSRVKSGTPVARLQSFRCATIERVWRNSAIATTLLFASCTYSMQWPAGSGSSELLAPNARRVASNGPREPSAGVSKAGGADEAHSPTNARDATRALPPANASASAITQNSLPAAHGDEAACYADLADAGVEFERISHAGAAGVAWPIKLSGTVDGIRIYGAKANAPTNYLDCRLALALLAWAPLLKAEGVVGLQHYSMYRHDATVGQTTKISGHALGRAIDVAFFDLQDGRRLSVLDDWHNRARGAEPCEVESSTDAERTMRDLVCEATERGLFQMILTPHYNDAHGNHVHLESGAADEGAWIG
jgi:hypothetical protein